MALKSAHQAPTPPMTSEDTRAFSKRLFDAYSKPGNLKQIRLFAEEFYSPNAITHIAGVPKPYNMEDMIDLWNALSTAAPDLQLELHDTIIEGNKIVWHYSLRFTHTGYFRELPPTGNKVEYEEISICRIADGKVDEVWAVLDSRTAWVGFGCEFVLPKT